MLLAKNGSIRCNDWDTEHATLCCNKVAFEDRLTVISVVFWGDFSAKNETLYLILLRTSLPESSSLK